MLNFSLSGGSFVLMLSALPAPYTHVHYSAETSLVGVSEGPAALPVVLERVPPDVQRVVRGLFAESSWPLTLFPPQILTLGATLERRRTLSERLRAAFPTMAVETFAIDPVLWNKAVGATALVSATFGTALALSPPLLFFRLATTPGASLCVRFALINNQSHLVAYRIPDGTPATENYTCIVAPPDEFAMAAHDALLGMWGDLCKPIAAAIARPAPFATIETFRDADANSVRQTTTTAPSSSAR